MRALQFEKSVSVRGLTALSRSSSVIHQPANSATTRTSGPVRGFITAVAIVDRQRKQSALTSAFVISEIAVAISM